MLTATKLTINFKFKPKPMLQVEQGTYVELLMLVLDFKVDYRLKILKSISVECRKCLNEDIDVQKKEEKYDAFCTSGVESLLGQTAQRQVQVLWIQ